MQLSFSKYHGAGNDFIVIDDRMGLFPIGKKQLIQELCDRHFGVGADGVLLLQNSSKADIRMRIFNADGSEAAMCGNGIRCLFHFAESIGACSKSAKVETEASIIPCSLEGEAVVVLHPEPKLLGRGIELSIGRVDLIDSGVPHALHFVKDISRVDVEGVGRAIRWDNQFAPHGANATFVQPSLDEGVIYIRTFERGVEGETKACGTAAIAAAYMTLKKGPLPGKINVSTMSNVIFETRLIEKGVELKGPATLIFTGNLTNLFN